MASSTSFGDDTALPPSTNSAKVSPAHVGRLHRAEAALDDGTARDSSLLPEPSTAYGPGARRARDAPPRGGHRRPPAGPARPPYSTGSALARLRLGGIGWLLLVLALVALVAIGALVVVDPQCPRARVRPWSAIDPFTVGEPMAPAGQRRGALPGRGDRGAGGHGAGAPSAVAAAGGGRPHRRRRRRALGDRPAGQQSDRTASRNAHRGDQVAARPPARGGRWCRTPLTTSAGWRCRAWSHAACPPGGHGPRCRGPAPPPRGPAAGEARRGES